MFISLLLDRPHPVRAGRLAKSAHVRQLRTARFPLVALPLRAAAPARRNAPGRLGVSWQDKPQGGQRPRRRETTDERPHRCVGARADRCGAGACRGACQRERQPLIEGFADEYFRQLDADDLAERARRGPARRAAVALAVRRDARARRSQGARAEPVAGRARLGLAPLGDRDRQRRHAVPGRLDDDGDQPAGPDAAPDRASDLRGRARRRGQAACRSRPRRDAPDARARIVDARRGRSAGRRAAARRAGRPASSACSATCAPRSKTGSRWSRACTRRSPSSRPRPRRCRRRRWRRAARSCTGWPRTTCTLLGYRQHDLVDRRTAKTRCGSCPAAASACCARPRPRQLSASFAALPPQARALARAPSPVLIVTKANTRSTVHRPGLHRLRRRQALRRRGRGDRRAPLPRPVHLDARTARAWPRRRCCAARSRRSPSAPACRRAGTWRRRSTTSSRPIRATSCSRSPTTSCTRPRSASCARRAAAAAPVHPPRPVRALRVVPRVRAARGLLDRPARASSSAS